MKNLLTWQEAIATVKMCFDESEKQLKKLLTETKINKQGIAGNYSRMFIRRIIADIKRQSRKTDQMIRKYKSDEELDKHYTGKNQITQEEKAHYEK